MFFYWNIGLAAEILQPQLSLFAGNTRSAPSQITRTTSVCCWDFTHEQTSAFFFVTRSFYLSVSNRRDRRMCFLKHFYDMKLLLSIRRSQWKWSWLIRTPPHASLRTPSTSSSGGDPGQTQNTLGDYTSHLSWESLGIPQEELKEVPRETGDQAELPPRLWAG